MLSRVLMKFAQNVWTDKKSWGQQIFELGWEGGVPHRPKC